MDDWDWLEEILLALPEGARRTLLRILTSAPSARALTISRLYRRPETRSLAELLIDLEEDDFVRAGVVETLRGLRAHR